MAAYVALTAMLFQRGSSESRDPDEEREGGSPLVRREDPLLRRLAALIYSYSLTLALSLLFLGSFVGHFFGSWRQANEDAALHGAPPVPLGSYIADAGFWFQSFQNWQSEFLSTALLVLLSIWLRHHGSPESKPVTAPDHQTGG